MKPDTDSSHLAAPSSSRTSGDAAPNAPSDHGELTFEEFGLLPMQYTTGISTDNYGLRMFRNERVGIQREVYTPRNPRTQRWGEGKSSLYMDNDKREFANVAELYVAWMHRVCGVPEAHPSNTDSASGSPARPGRDQMNGGNPHE